MGEPDPVPADPLRFREVDRFSAPSLISTVPAKGQIFPFLAGETDGDELLLTDGRNGIGLRRRAGRVSLLVRRFGRWTTVRRERLPAGTIWGAALALVLCENQATVLTEREGTWHPVLTERRRVRALLDFRSREVLRGLRWQGARRSGAFGHAGLRDPHLVQHADGTPWTEGGRYFLTLTCAGLGFFAQAHWSVWSFDAATIGTDRFDLRREATLLTRRDGRVLGDHAGQLVRDGDEWLVMTSSWGDFSPRRGVHSRWTRSRADLVHGTHLIETTPMPLPTRMSSWDPGATLIDEEWFVSFVESPSQKPFEFRPALARGSLDALRRVGAARRTQTEGPVLVDLNGWHLLASDALAKQYCVFDLQMRAVGQLGAPYLSNIPHPQLLRHGDRWLMLTFDGTNPNESVLGYGGHGDVVVLASQALP